MLLQILSHTPAYVWAILVALIGLGLMQVRERRVALPQVLALPLVLLGLGLWSMAPAFAAQPLVALAWLGALALGTAGGRLTPQQPGTAWLAAERRFRVPGSWLPMAFIVVIFVLRYAAGVASALHPEWRGDPTVQLPLALVFGGLAGLSLGRALGLLRLRGTGRRAGATIAGHA